MKNPNVAEQVRNYIRQGWGTRKISEALDISRNTVKKLRDHGWQPYKRPTRPGKLDGLDCWLRQKFFQHDGNADVIRQELKQEQHIEVSLRSIERKVKPLRQELHAAAIATVRFETPPGQQMQIDFGEKSVSIAGAQTKVHFFVATLGFSRKRYVKAFHNQTQPSWFCGIEEAFRYFGGVPKQLLIDNARALVTKNDRSTGELEFSKKFKAFASYWNLQVSACAPYRARTKGKDENSVKYVKKNCIAGRQFASWEAMESHIAVWLKDIADSRPHGTTGQPPEKLFAEQEREKLRSLNGRPPFLQILECERRVGADAHVMLDRSFYSVPCRYIGETVTVQATEGSVAVFYSGTEIARHLRTAEPGKRICCPEHLEGIIRRAGGKTPPPQDKTQEKTQETQEKDTRNAKAYHEAQKQNQCEATAPSGTKAKAPQIQDLSPSTFHRDLSCYDKAVGTL